MPITHGPVDEHLVDNMKAVCSAIDETLNGENCPREKKNYGFVLLVMPFGEDPDRNRINYMSNGERSNMIAAMKEMIERDKKNT